MGMSCPVGRDAANWKLIVMEKDLDLEGEEGWLRVQHLLTDRLITIYKILFSLSTLKKFSGKLKDLFIYFFKDLFCINRSG